MKNVIKIIKQALKEDKANKDVTALFSVARSAKIKARLIAKQQGIISGLHIFAKTFKVLDRKIFFKQYVKDGSKVEKGKILAEISGPARSILSAERTALNFIQHMSGISTITGSFVAEVKGTGARIYDTRKTIPGMRPLAKYAVLCGGGFNHRMDLSEMALIKDNHLIMIKDLNRIIKAIKKKRASLKVQVECENIKQVKNALASGADLILFDNMNTKQIKKALKLVKESSVIRGFRPETEISGGVTLKTVRNYALTGVNRISIGALTHSVPALDLSLELTK